MYRKYKKKRRTPINMATNRTHISTPTTKVMQNNNNNNENIRIHIQFEIKFSELIRCCCYCITSPSLYAFLSQIGSVVFSTHTHKVKYMETKSENFY